MGLAFACRLLRDDQSLMQASFEYVGIGIRFVAQLIDAFIASIIASFIVTAAGYEVTTSTGLSLGYVPIIMIGIFFAYFTLMEGFFGATAGKMIFKVKVLQEDGNPCGVGRAAVRNLLRFIDALPFLYLVGFILITRSEKKQRLGDRVAKTVVVKPRPISYSYPPPPPPTYPPPPPTQTTIPPPYPPPPPPSSIRSPVKYCMSCGAQIPIQAMFCPKCGASQ